MLAELGLTDESAAVRGIWRRSFVGFPTGLVSVGFRAPERQDASFPALPGLSLLSQCLEQSISRSPCRICPIWCRAAPSSWGGMGPWGQVSESCRRCKSCKTGSCRPCHVQHGPKEPKGPSLYFLWPPLSQNAGAPWTSCNGCQLHLSVPGPHPDPRFVRRPRDALRSWTTWVLELEISNRRKAAGESISRSYSVSVSPFTLQIAFSKPCSHASL